jgi:hypothetical protein
MSSLGIRFATPYRGSNGIKVTGSTIEIDPEGDINTKNLQAKETIRLININGITIWEVNQEEEMFLKNGNNEITFYVNADILALQKNSENFFLVDNLTESLTIFNDSFGNAILNNSSLQFEQIGINNVDGFVSISENLSSVSSQFSGAVTPALNKYLIFNIAGVDYKIIIAQ